MKLSQIRQRKKVVAVDFLGEILTITYNPGAVTPSLTMQDESIVAEMAAIIQDWDLLGDDEQPYPITEESLNALPLDFLAQVLRRIIEDAAPNLKTPGV